MCTNHSAYRQLPPPIGILPDESMSLVVDVAVLSAPRAS
jgi:hypothetical protein